MDFMTDSYPKVHGLWFEERNPSIIYTKTSPFLISLKGGRGFPLDIGETVEKTVS